MRYILTVCGAIRKKCAVVPASRIASPTADQPVLLLPLHTIRTELTFVPPKEPLRLQRLPKTVEWIRVERSADSAVGHCYCWFCEEEGRVQSQEEV